MVDKDRIAGMINTDLPHDELVEVLTRICVILEIDPKDHVSARYFYPSNFMDEIVATVSINKVASARFNDLKQAVIAMLQ